MASIHGHEVLQMMIESKQNYTDASLLAAIEQKYGVDARFHTCSNSNMTATELVNFLKHKGKFIVSENSFTTNASKICNH